MTKSHQIPNSHEYDLFIVTYHNYFANVFITNSMQKFESVMDLFVTLNVILPQPLKQLSCHSGMGMGKKPSKISHVSNSPHN